MESALLICGKFAEMIPVSGRMACVANEEFLAIALARLAMPECWEVVTLVAIPARIGFK